MCCVFVQDSKQCWVCGGGVGRVLADGDMRPVSVPGQAPVPDQAAQAQLPQRRAALPVQLLLVRQQTEVQPQPPRQTGILSVVTLAHSHLHSPLTGSSRVRSGRVRSGQVRSGQVRSGQFGSEMGDGVN